MSRRFEHLADLEVLQVAVDEGGFTAAARRLGLSPSAVSRSVDRLEQHLGVRLLRRSTRRLALTEAGQQFLGQTRAALAMIEGAERDARGESQRVSGVVRLSVPTTWGHYRAAPKLAAFRRRYPEVIVELNVGNRNVDLLAEGFDAVVRLGEPRDSAGLIARPIERAPLRLVASPGYLAWRGPPDSLDALLAHDCVPFVLPSTGRIVPWLFHDGESPIDWTPPTSWRVSDDVLGCVALAEAGAGIAQSYDFVLEGPLRDGRLVELLPELSGRTRPFMLLYPAERYRSPAARALIDALLETSGDATPHPPGTK